MHLVMFDIDGTLVNSYKFDEECYLEAAQTVLGIKISSSWGDYEHFTDVGILGEAIDRYEISGDKKEIQKNFKKVYIELIAEYVGNNPSRVCEIEGAACFIRYLSEQENCRVAIATGCWEETAKLKLKAAGIDVNGYAFASSSDCQSRVDIMSLAESRASATIPFKSKTYFGDASWDKKASELMKYRFIAVGNRTKHKNQIRNFENIESILALLNL